VRLEHNTTIGDALKTLAKHNILSAPMVRGCALGQKGTSYITHQEAVACAGARPWCAPGRAKGHPLPLLVAAQEHWRHAVGAHATAPAWCGVRTGSRTRQHGLICFRLPAFHKQVMYPDIEEVQGGDMSPQLLGWIDVADVMRAFLQREPAVLVLAAAAAVV